MELFTIYSDNGQGTTPVSNLFIDEYMRDANDAQLKVYLYLLRSMHSRRPTSISDMADQFNHTEKEILRSLRYWEAKGLLTLRFDSNRDLMGIRLTRLQEPLRQDGGMIHVEMDPSAETFRQDAGNSVQEVLSAEPERQIPAPAVPASASMQPASPAPAAKDKTEEPQSALEAFRSNKKRAQLLFVIEQYIGKPLSPSEIQTVYYISEELHFSDALIDYLLQYCIDRGKKDFRYIEKVAVNWAENGITTPRQAEHAVSPLHSSGRNTAGTKPSANKFNQFTQNRYDFDQLEQQILGG